MSAYRVIEMNAESSEEVRAGLIALGFPSEIIEMHNSAVNLKDWNGNSTRRKGEVVVRRKQVDKFFNNSLSNDLGFEKTENGYKAHISSEHQSWWKENQGKFKQAVSEQRIVKKARTLGYSIQKQVLGDGSIKIRTVKSS